jgi:hypothetical protein
MVMKEIKIKKYVYEKVLKDDILVSIPEETIYYEILHSFVAVIPTKDHNENLHGLKVVEITNSSITKCFINLSSISDILYEASLKNSDYETVLKKEVINQLSLYYNNDRISADIFNSKLNSFLNSFLNSLV